MNFEAAGRDGDDNYQLCSHSSSYIASFLLAIQKFRPINTRSIPCRIVKCLANPYMKAYFWYKPVFAVFLLRTTLAAILFHRAIKLGPGHLGELPQVDGVVLRVVDRWSLVVKMHLEVVHSVLTVGCEVLHGCMNRINSTKRELSHSQRSS